MTRYTSIKPKLVERLAQITDQYWSALHMSPEQRDAYIDQRYKDQIALVADDPSGVLMLGFYNHRNAYSIASEAQTIIFSADQADVFQRTPQDYADTLEYRLPFRDVLIQFDRPVSVSEPLPMLSPSPARRSLDKITALLLRQVPLTYERFQEEVRQAIDEARRFGVTDFHPQVAPQTEGEFFNNVVVVVFETGHVIRFTWTSESLHETPFGDLEMDQEWQDAYRYYRTLAVTCIGFINCENVTLHREGVPEKVNRKREAKGKSRIEPYYVCRIRGVTYDSEGRTGIGVEHGHRYDVRGHFRRLGTGQVTWVRPHQRGLKHELYIPKTYIVAKGEQDDAS